MKFGIIGAGMIANFHAKAIAAMEAGELHSFYGRRQEAVDELVAENGGKGYTDLDEFLNDPELDISSLVDVAFLLLIYFLVTSTLRPDETDLSIVLPSQVPNENPLDIDPIAIVIGPDGSVTYNEEPIPLSGGSGADRLPDLRQRLKAYKDLADGTNQEAMVTVKADDDGKTQRFIDVVNALASVKIKNVTMTGFRDEEE